MSDVRKVWQAALKERGDKAFELFCKKADTSGFEKLNSNAEFNIDCRLKPIRLLIKIDFERYAENAFLLYKDASSNRHVLDIIHQNNNGYTERKLYANIPFNLEWARAGVAVECKIEDCYEICDFVQITSDTDISVMCGEVWIHGVDFKAMRHPFPPVVE